MEKLFGIAIMCSCVAFAASTRAECAERCCGDTERFSEQAEADPRRQGLGKPREQAQYRNGSGGVV